MNLNNNSLLLCLPLLFGIISSIAGVSNTYARPEKVEIFIDTMVSDHGYDREQISKIFGQVKTNSKVLQAIKRPSTSKPIAWN